MAERRHASLSYNRRAALYDHPMIRMLFLILLSPLAVLPLRADFRAYNAIPADPALQSAVDRIAAETLGEYEKSKLTDGNLSISLIDMTESPRRASYREEIPYHPASVVKAVFLVVAHDQLDRGKLKMSAELQRAMRDMIVESSNDATSYVVDAISGTSSGPELEGRAWKVFRAKRDVANRFFHSRGYDINANGKTWCEGVYGREKQLLGINREYRNRMTSASAAALMFALVSGNFRKRAEMFELLGRPLSVAGKRTSDQQVVEFLGEALPEGARLWSKAGWTGEVRHDLAYVELPNGRKFIAAIFTRGASADTSLVPAIGKKIVKLFHS